MIGRDMKMAKYGVGEIMRKKIILSFIPLIFTLLVGCATTYNSIGEADRSGYEIIVAKEKTVFDAAYEAISSNFPKTIITSLAGNEKGFSFFTQPMLDRTTFKFLINEVSGTSLDGKEINGFTYSIYSYGSQFFVNSRYVEPLKEKFKSILTNKNITLTKASSITFKK